MCAVPSNCCDVECACCVYLCVCESVRRAICVCRVPLCDRETREREIRESSAFTRAMRAQQAAAPPACGGGRRCQAPHRVIYNCILMSI